MGPVHVRLGEVGIGIVLSRGRWVLRYYTTVQGIKLVSIH